MPASAAELSYLEKKVLLALQKRKKASPEELKVAGKFRELVEVMNATSWLQAKGLVTMKERVLRTYRLARPQVARRALPERKALTALLRAGGRLPVPRLQSVCKFDDGQLAVALGWLRRKGWAEVSRGPAGSVVAVTPAGRAAAKVKGPDEQLLVRLAKEELAEDTIDPRLVRDLKSRRDLVKERESVRREITLTPMGEKILPAVRCQGVRAPHSAGQEACAGGLHREDPADLPEHGLHRNPGGLRPPGVLELRCPLPAARPSSPGPARHVLPLEARQDAAARRTGGAARRGSPRDRRVDWQHGLAVPVEPGRGRARGPAVPHDTDHPPVARRAPGAAAEGVHHRAGLPARCDRRDTPAGVPPDRGRRYGGRRESRAAHRH